MDTFTTSWTLAELADGLGCALDGPEDLVIRRPVPYDSDDPSGIAFAESAKFVEVALQHQVGALIVQPGVEVGDKPCLRAQNPRHAFFGVLQMARRPIPLEVGIHPSAIIHPKAWVSASASVGANVVIEKNARIEERCKLYAGSYVGEDCWVKEDAILYPNVVLMQDVWVGERSIIHANSVLGADGFGYVFDGQTRIKVPQVGGVRIGADVELGAGVCVDRAMCGETSIGQGTKIDNLVQVAHNVRIGDHTVIAGHTSLAGSVRIGSRVTMGGQAGVKDHVVVTDDVVLAGRTGVMSDIEQKGEYWGLPAVPMREALRQTAAMRQLPDLVKRLKRLEAEIEELKASKPS